MLLHGESRVPMRQPFTLRQECICFTKTSENLKNALLTLWSSRAIFCSITELIAAEKTRSGLRQQAGDTSEEFLTRRAIFELQVICSRVLQERCRRSASLACGAYALRSGRLERFAIGLRLCAVSVRGAAAPSETA